MCRQVSKMALENPVHSSMEGPPVVQRRQGAVTKRAILKKLSLPYGQKTIASGDSEHAGYGYQPKRSSSMSPMSLTQDEVKPYDTLDQGIESFGYDPVQNGILLSETIKNGTIGKRYLISVLRYLILFLIGLCTGVCASVIDYLIQKIAGLKFIVVGQLISRFSSGWSVAIPAFAYCAINVVLVFISSCLVVFLAPVAAGSGIPLVKCYLNGLNIPRLVRGLTMFVKGAGLVFAVSGGLAVGKEGPMIHIGSAIAAGISQGRLTYFKISTRALRFFRNDQQKRDFVSAGAAAGVAAAFGAPVGGLLFALEEGASFVYQRLTWTILFASMISMFVLAFFKTLMDSGALTFTPGGLISFGTFNTLDNYTLYEILIFLVMGVLGGLAGALFVKTNVVITRYRQRYVISKAAKITEAVLVGFLTSAFGFLLMSVVRDCSTVAYTTAPYPQKMMCADHEFNPISSLFFSTPERSLRVLFHEPAGTFKITTLLIFFVVYSVISCFTYGVSVSSGVFIPSLLIGASWGRVIGILMNLAFPEQFPDPGKFALIGGAAQLGGIVRMTVSLTVILMEATGNVIVGLPLLMTLIVAKYTGDYFSNGIYDEHIELSSLALLPWEPDPLASSKRAYDIMSSPVTYFSPVMRVSEIVRLTASDLHHGFPIVEGPADPSRFSYGTLVGLISSEHLGILLRHKIFLNEDGTPKNVMTFKEYDDAYPSYPKFQSVLDTLTDEDMDACIDFRPYMCEAPYSVPETMAMNRIYHLFRLLGLRHLPVVDRNNQLRGMITRKDLCRFRFEATGGEFHVEELMFSTKASNLRNAR